MLQKGNLENLNIQSLDLRIIQLNSFLNSKDLQVIVLEETDTELQVTLDILENYHQYHTMALLLQKHQVHSRALSIWNRLAIGELADTAFPGLEIIVSYLRKLSEKELVLRYGGWLLRRDSSKGVQIFVNREDNVFETTEVLEYLESFGTKATTEYLEALIQKSKENPVLNTKLAILYLNDILHYASADNIAELDNLFRIDGQNTYVYFLKKRSDPFCKARLKFHDFITSTKKIDFENLDNFLNTHGGLLTFEKASLAISVMCKS
jgi:hypothetical protein